MRLSTRHVAPFVLVFGLAACAQRKAPANGPDPEDPVSADPSAPDPSAPTLPSNTSTVSPLQLSGQVVDFVTGLPVDSSVILSAQGLSPAPAITIDGASFSLSEVTPFTNFTILAGAPPSHRMTYNVATAAGDNANDLKVRVVSEEAITQMADEASLTPQAGRAIVLARFIGTDGAAVTGLPRAALRIDGALPPRQPNFLDETFALVANATASTGSGWAVLWNVTPGPISITTPVGSGYEFASDKVQAAANLVTLVEVRVSGSAVTAPMNVSFRNQVIPILTKRECTTCHSDDNIGVEEGGLTLRGPMTRVYNELVNERSPNTNTMRVDRVNPANSLFLTRPSPETPADPHPRVIFTGPTDPDYLTILAWIQQGALMN